MLYVVTAFVAFVVWLIASKIWPAIITPPGNLSAIVILLAVGLVALGRLEETLRAIGAEARRARRLAPPRRLSEPLEDPAERADHAAKDLE